MRSCLNVRLCICRYDGYGDNNPESIKKRKHIRSNSCDVKIGRSNSQREYDPDYRNRRGFAFGQRRGHSRGNSHDLDFEHRHRRPPTHSRTSSRDEPMNMKYILSCLKPDASTNRLLMSSAALMATAAAAEHGASRAVRKHCRNHSYDQIYGMPHNSIKIDQEFHNRLNRHRALGATASSPVIENDGHQQKMKNAATTTTTNQNYSANNKEYLDNRLINPKVDMPPASTIISIGSHSRTNSKDLNRAAASSNFLSSLVDDAANILRHRRTNSKDLNRILNPMPSTSETGPLTTDSSMTTAASATAAAAATAAATQYHKRNASLPPPNDLREENTENDVAHVLLLGDSENHSDNLQMNRREND